MPGLVGIISKYETDGHLLDKMAQVIKHKKWYKINQYKDSLLKIARVHLGIFNPEPQPIFNEDKSVLIFMDGKIYDYEEEKNKLKRKGYKFHINNDAEFCLHLYKELGKNFVKKLNGAFAIIIYDLKNKKVLIVNDRYGLRPVYYTENGNRFLFASEVKAILEDKEFKRELNNETVAEFFALGEMLGDKTWFKNINTLPHASIWIYNQEKWFKEQYWNFQYAEDSNFSEEELAEQLAVTFKKAVKARLRDNLQYGVALSGGLDSRAILGAVEKDKKNQLTTINFGLEDCDESKVARMVAEKAKVNHKFIKLNPDELIPYTKEAIYLSDGLDMVTVCYLPYVNRIINKYTDVLFKGLAMDLTLGGSYLSSEILNLKDNQELFKKIHKKMSLFPEDMLQKLFKKDYYNKIKDIPKQSLKRSLDKVKEENLANKNDNFFLRNHVRRLTIMGHVLMRNSIEDSLPTYDNNFLNVVFKIPPKLRLNHYIYKKFLKKLSSDLLNVPYQRTMLPASWPFTFWIAGMGLQFIKKRFKQILFRLSKGKIFIPHKRGYINFEDHLRVSKIWKNFVRETLLNKKALSKKYFNQSYIATLISEHETGKANHWQRIMQLVTFELFLKLFITNQNEKEYLDN